MRKFVLRISAVLFPIVLINFVIGLARDFSGDETIPFRQNWLKQFVTRNQRLGKVGLQTSSSQVFDMSNELRVQPMVRSIDKWGFQNISDIRNPEVLFIGDSFFDDPFLSYFDGLSHNFSSSMNIASAGCSGFEVFNELSENGYFTVMPKFIVIEIVERNVYNWSELFEQIERKRLKTMPYNLMGLDLLLGNNCKGFSSCNMPVFSMNSKTSRIGTPRVLEDNRVIYFYRNSITEFNARHLVKVLDSMKKTMNHFEKYGSSIVFLVAPDKESIYPELFPSSHLPRIQNSFDSVQIPYIDMYSAMMQSPQRKDFYYDGDTHWNQNAYKLLIEKIRLQFQSKKR